MKFVYEQVIKKRISEIGKSIIYSQGINSSVEVNDKKEVEEEENSRVENSQVSQHIIQTAKIKCQ